MHYKKSKQSPKSSDHWLYGTHAVEAALMNPKRTITKVLATAKTESYLKDLLKKVNRSLVPHITSPDYFKDVLGYGAVHQDVAVLSKPLVQPDFASWIKKIRSFPDALVLILDSVTDPQNIGSIIRSSAAFGLKGIVVHKHNAPSETATMVKVASGGFEHIPLIAVPNLSEALKVFKEEGFWTYGMTEHTDSTLSTLKLDQKCVFVLGAEGSGLRPLVAKNCDVLAKLPTQPPIESLNVAQAATVCLYEYIRQHPTVI